MSDEEPAGGEPPALSARAVLLAGFTLELSLILVAAVLGWGTRGVPFPFRFQLDLEGLAWGLGATAPMGVLAIALTSPAADRIGWLRRINEVVTRLLGDAVRELSVLELLCLAAAAGLGEEVLFRGVLQQVAGAWGLWIASLVFGLLHALTPGYFLMTTGIGVYLGWVQVFSGNLLAPVIVHGAYDAIALCRFRQRLLVERER
ncbi:MAG: CPBP family intramembrane metalloprotease [Planctomycetes bacterium]|nr:CPBP family intramembrane metalloprotease [Planctomycetota bacterium]